MRLRSREGVWYAEGYYVESGQKRRWKRSTGVRDDGTRAAKQAAEANGREFQVSLALGVGRDQRPKTTIKEAVTKLIKDMVRSQKAAPTIGIVIAKAANLFEFFGPQKPCREITTTEQLAEYADWSRQPRIDDAGRQRRGRGPGTIQRELLTLTAALKTAGFTAPKLPDLGKVYAPRERWLDQAESVKFIQHIGRGWREHVMMYRMLGLTLSELYRITPRDVFMDRQEVRVRGTKTKYRDRLIPFGPEIAAILKRRLRLAEIGRDPGPLFEPWQNINRDLHRAAKAAGIAPVSCNDLRRSFATEMAIKGVPMLHLMHLMGHSSTAMLEKVYARVGRGEHMHSAIGLLSPLGALVKQAESSGTTVGQTPRNARTTRTAIGVREAS